MSTVKDEAIKLRQNIDAVYEAAEESGIRAMWDEIQQYGKRTSYAQLFAGGNLTAKTFKPRYDFKPTSMYLAFQGCPAKHEKAVAEGQVDMKKYEEENGIVFDFSKCINISGAFSGPLFSAFNVIDLSLPTGADQVFYGGYYYIAYPQLLPKRIERLIINEKLEFTSSSFGYAYGFTYIGFEGVIGKSIDLSACPLVPDSMKKAILCLKNYSGTDNEYVYNIKFNADCWMALETDSTPPTGSTWREYVDSLGWNT